MPVGGDVIAAAGSARTETSQQLLRAERLAEVEAIGVERVFEKLPVEHCHAVRPDGDIAQARRDLIARNQLVLAPPMPRRQVAGTAENLRPERVRFAVRRPDFRRHEDAFHPVFPRRHWHEVVVQAVPGFGEAASVLLGHGANGARHESADDPVRIVRRGNRQRDPVGLWLFPIDGQLDRDSDSAFHLFAKRSE